MATPERAVDRARRRWIERATRAEIKAARATDAVGEAMNKIRFANKAIEKANADLIETTRQLKLVEGYHERMRKEKKRDRIVFGVIVGLMAITWFIAHLIL